MNPFELLLARTASWSPLEEVCDRFSSLFERHSQVFKSDLWSKAFPHFYSGKIYAYITGAGGKIVVVEEISTKSRQIFSIEYMPETDLFALFPSNHLDSKL